MAGENQNEDLSKIAAEQAKLEAVRNSAETSESLKSKLGEYKATYINALSSGKQEILAATSLVKSKDAQDYLKINAYGLRYRVEDLAKEGQAIFNSEKGANPDKKKEYPTLTTLKTDLAKQLTAQKAEIAQLTAIETARNSYLNQKKLNDQLNEGSTLSNLANNKIQKDNLLKNLDTALMAAGKLSADANPTITSFRNDLVKDLTSLKTDVSDDVNDAAFLLKGQADLAKQGVEINTLSQKISTAKAPLDAKTYSDFQTQLKSQSASLGEKYVSLELDKITTLAGPFLDKISKTFYSSVYKPHEDKLESALTLLETKKPATSEKVEADPELEAIKDSAAAKAEFAKYNLQIDALAKELAAAAKDKQIQLDYKAAEAFLLKVNALEVALGKVESTYKITEKMGSPSASIRAISSRLQTEYYQPALAKIKDLKTNCDKRNSEIKDFQREKLNEQLTKDLATLDQNWQKNVNEQKQFLAQPTTFDESKPEFKTYLEGEKSLFAFVVSVESQANFVLNQKDSVVIWDNQKRFQEYQKLAQGYQNQIIANRAYRSTLKAAQGEQDQTFEYSVKTGTKTVRPPAGAKGADVGSYEVDVFETRKDTFKFNECVEFVDPNDPKYKEINGGKGWKFKKDNLPQSVQDRFSLQAGNIINDQKKAAEEASFSEKGKILSVNKLYDKSREELGEQGKLYFQAVDAFSSGKLDQAIKLYQQYIDAAKTFSKEDQEKHQKYVNEAQRQVDVFNNSAEFYEGLNLLNTKQLDAALSKFREYIKKIKALDPKEQSKYAEQLAIAVETLRQVNTAKLTMLIDLKDDLKFVEARSVAMGNPSLADKDNFDKALKTKDGFKDFQGTKRQIMLPYIPFDQLTEEDKKMLAEGKGGLQGPEIVELEEAVAALKLKIDKGEPVNFEDEYAAIKKNMAKFSKPETYPGASKYTGLDGKVKVDCTVSRLDDYFDRINSTDAKVREKGFVEISDYFKGEKVGMRYTQKYLDKAMVYRYVEFEESEKASGKAGETKESVRKRLLADPAIAGDLKKGALEQYKRWAEEQNRKLPYGEKPYAIDPPDAFMVQSFQTRLFEQKFRYQYEREMRKKMTDSGKANSGSALERYNTSLPYNDGSGRWYKPWSWSDYNEDEWNDFKDEATKFAIETIVTLPIGMGAGAIGRAVGRGALSMLMKQGLKAEAIALLEEGGIVALRSSSTVWESVPAAMRQTLMAQRWKVGAAYATGLAAEGTAMLVMNGAWEGLSTGHNSEAFKYLDAGNWSHVGLALGESIVKAGFFRAFGASQGKMQNALQAEKSIVKKALGTAAIEIGSGTAGASLEAVSMLAKGQGNQITFDFWMKSIGQNALQSLGSHVGHKVVELPKVNLEKKTLDKFEKVNQRVALEKLTGQKLFTDEGEIMTPKLKAKQEADQKAAEKKAGSDPDAPAPKPVSDALIEPTLKPLDIHDVKVSPDNKLIINGKKTELTPIEINSLPAGYRERVAEKYAETKAVETRKRINIELPKLVELRELILEYEKLSKDPESNPTRLAELDKVILTESKKRHASKDELLGLVKSQIELYHAMEGMFQNKDAYYAESKKVKIPQLDGDGKPLMGPDNKPLFKEVNLFENYDSKSAAYSKKLFDDIDHQALTAAGGVKIIKIGGDELVVFHAAENGTVQKLFIDISNMGPANDAAVNIGGSRINLVDIYLYKVSEAIKSQSIANKGKALVEADFLKSVKDVSDSLFAIDHDSAGKPLDTASAQAKYQKLKQEWGLEASFADYQKSVQTMRVMAEYRADTRSLDASYKEQKGKVTFEEHIVSQIEQIGGLPFADLQKLLLENKAELVSAIQARIPQLDKFYTKDAQGKIIGGPPSAEQILQNIAKLNPKTSKAENLMQVYALLARLDLSQSKSPALQKLSQTLDQTRSEFIGEPPHVRVEAPRIMDGKVVSIPLPPDVMTALRQLAETDPVRAHAILSAARTLAEAPLDKLKYKKNPEFAKFNIYEHIEIKEGKISIKKEAKEFQEAFDINLKDKKVANIVAIEKAINDLQIRLEQVRQAFANNKMDKLHFDAEMKEIEAKSAELEIRLATDPDTGAYTQTYLDVKPTRMYGFPDGQIPVYDRIWHSVTTELSHAGVINSKYGYLGMDTVMKAYHDVLKSNISALLPANLQHFKIIRSGGGKFEIVFLDAKSLEALAKKGYSPESLIAELAAGPGQQAVDKILKADADKVAKSQTDAAVRNSLFINLKGNPPLEVGRLTTKNEIPVTAKEISEALSKNPKASAREILGLVAQARAQKATILPSGSDSPLLTPTGKPVDTTGPEATAVREPGTPPALFRSKFAETLPAEVLAEGKPAHEVPAFIDKSGQIFYNSAFFEAKFKVKLITTEKGGNAFVYKGETYSPKQFFKLPVGREVLAQMNTAKPHETVHRTAELIDKQTGGKLTEQIQKAIANNPELKSAFDQSGHANDARGIQEFIAELGDGKFTGVSPSTIRFVELSITAVLRQYHLQKYGTSGQESLPTFSYKHVRKLDTVLLTKHSDKGDFSRDFIDTQNLDTSQAAPKLVGGQAPAEQAGPPWKMVDSATAFNEILASEKGQESNHKIARQIFTDIMSAVRSGDPKQVEMAIGMNEAFVSRKVLERIAKEIPIGLRDMAETLSSPRGYTVISRMEEAGTLTPVSRELYKQLAKESKLIIDKLSKKDAKGIEKTPERKAQDLAELKAEVSAGFVSINPYTASRLVLFPEGIKILSEQINGSNYIRTAIKNGQAKLSDLPPEVQKSLTKEAHAKFIEQLTKDTDTTFTSSLKLEFTLDKFEAALFELQNNQYFSTARLGDLPHPVELILSGADGLPTTAVAKLLRGQIEIKSNIESYGKDGQKTKNIMIIEGAGISEGGFGKTYKSYIYEGNSHQPQELVSKKLISAIKLESITEFKNLPPAKQKAIQAVLDGIQFDGTVSKKPAQAALKSIESILGRKIKVPEGVAKVDPFYALVDFKYNSYLEGRNSRLIAEKQAQGKLKGFMEVKYISPDGQTLIYSDLSTNGNVRSYDNILKGKSDATHQEFWTGVADVIAALRESSMEGVVHYDIKPHNIIIGADGKAKIIDFGTMLTKQDVNAMSYPADSMTPELVASFGKDSPFDPYQPTIYGTPLPSTQAYMDSKKAYQAVRSGEPGKIDTNLLAKSLEVDLINSENPNIQTKFLTPPELVTALNNFIEGKITPEQFEKYLRINVK